MHKHPPRGRALPQLVGWLALLALPGCLSCFHPVGPAPCELSGPCLSQLKCCRDHVYVFMLHGLDPFNCANLSGVRDYVQSLGFNKTYYGQLYHAGRFEDEIRRIHGEDPDAHFVLIGFSVGGGMVHSMARTLESDGVFIDLLVYLDPKTFTDDIQNRPANVGKVVNILTAGTVWNGEPLADAENLRVADVRHFGAATHQQTLVALANGLVEIAAKIPSPDDLDSGEVPPASSGVPTGQGDMAERSDDWGFLRPLRQISHNQAGEGGQAP